MITKANNSEFLLDAIQLYKRHWELAWVGHSDQQECNFDGSILDIDMLGYCEYELGHPEENYKAASFIWGNVIQKHTNLEWGIQNNQYFLFTDEDGYCNFNINVHSYIAEIINSNISQFESFSIATEKVALDMVLSNYPTDVILDLVTLVNSIVNDCDTSYSEQVAYAASELFNNNQGQIKKIKDSLEL